MRALSTVLWLLAACSVHVGVAPSASVWSVHEVAAPVAEPDVDMWVREGLQDALSARRAFDPAAPTLVITVTEAAWTPARRSGGVLLYDARLSVRVQAGETVITRTRVWTAVDPGNAGDARSLREVTLRMLARQVAEDAVAVIAAG